MKCARHSFKFSPHARWRGRSDIRPHCVKLNVIEVVNLALVMERPGNGEDVLDLAAVSGLFEHHEAEEGADLCKPQFAGLDPSIGGPRDRQGKKQ